MASLSTFFCNFDITVDLFNNIVGKAPLSLMQLHISHGIVVFVVLS